MGRPHNNYNAASMNNITIIAATETVETIA
jgi:hypothetical protein